MVDRDVLDGLHAEAVRTLQRQMATVEDLDSKATAVLRFNALVIGLTVSAAAIAARGLIDGTVLPNWIPVMLLLGALTIAVSTLLALLAYEVTKLAIGMRAADMTQVIDSGMEHLDFLEHIVHTYADAVQRNRAAVDRTASRLRLALWTLQVGLVQLAVSLGGFIYVAG